MRTRLNTRLGRILAGVVVTLAFAGIGLVVSAFVVSGARSTGVTVPPAALFGGARHLAPARPVRRHFHLSRFETLVARGRGRTVALYRRPGARRPYRRLGRLRYSYGTPVVFLVERRRRHWLRVSLPIRPNHSSAWVRRSSVRLAGTGYRVTVALHRHRVTVWDGRRRVARRPIGVGRAVTPTPPGRYFVTDLLRPPEPDGVFGKFAFGLSAYSNVLTTFAGGDGQIGLHGTNDPAGLGTDVSHGCIRVSNPFISWLARRLPLGTPVVIER